MLLQPSGTSPLWEERVYNSHISETFEAMSYNFSIVTIPALWSIWLLENCRNIISPLHGVLVEFYAH